MRSHIRGDSDIIKKEVERQLKEKAYDNWRESANDLLASGIAIVLRILELRGWHKDRLVKLFNEYVYAVSTPFEVLGREVDDKHIIESLTEKYGIDFGRIQVNCADFEAGQKRAAEHNRKMNRIKEERQSSVSGK